MVLPIAVKIPDILATVTHITPKILSVLVKISIRRAELLAIGLHGVFVTGRPVFAKLLLEVFDLLGVFADLTAILADLPGVLTDLSDVATNLLGAGGGRPKRHSG